MKRRMLVLVAVFCLTLATLFPPAAAKSLSRDYWGAIAYSFKTGAVGFSWDHPTQEDAINAAVEECDEDDCKGVLWFRNSCGAFANATGDDPGYGWAIGHDQNDASAKALAECRKRGTGCKLVRVQCTTTR